VQFCACCLLLCIRALRWLPQASLIKHAFEALCINEFKGLTFEADENGGGMKTGAHLLATTATDVAVWGGCSAHGRSNSKPKASSPRVYGSYKVLSWHQDEHGSDLGCLVHTQHDAFYVCGIGH
jgi:hypothetical protein